VEGSTVAQFIDGGRTFTPRRALEIAREVADALRVAHEHGVLHRDVKSDNIMIDEQDQVKVLDFGIAKDLNATRRITQGEVYLGTPEYCSPEQLCSLPMDARTDVYSLGVVLHEMLTGVVPFRGTGTVELYHEKRRNRRPPLARLLPGAPRSLVRLLNRFLASNPVRRFASMAEAVAAIDEVIPTLGAFGWGDHSVRRFARRRTSSRRRPRLVPEAIASLFF
jgi:serine/threonine protein kinase